MPNETIEVKFKTKDGKEIPLFEKQEREPTNLKDKNGNMIFVNDIVEFYFDERKGITDSDSPNLKGYTKMVDIVKKIDGEYFACCSVGASYLWRCHKHCKVIGTHPELVEGISSLEVLFLRLRGS